jgi:hypothetical protein
MKCPDCGELTIFTPPVAGQRGTWSCSACGWTRTTLEMIHDAWLRLPPIPNQERRTGLGSQCGPGPTPELALVGRPA